MSKVNMSGNQSMAAAGAQFALLRSTAFYLHSGGPLFGPQQAQGRLITTTSEGFWLKDPNNLNLGHQDLDHPRRHPPIVHKSTCTPHARASSAPSQQACTHAKPLQQMHSHQPTPPTRLHEHTCCLQASDASSTDVYTDKRPLP